MGRKTLTDRYVKSLKAAPEGRRYDEMDSVVPGFGVRVTDKGQKTFILLARFPGSSNPTRRAIGEVGALELAEARNRGREWLLAIQRGIDPKALAERQRQAELRRQRHTFKSVVKDFTEKHLAGLRTGHDMARDLQREFVSLWGNRPISDIDRHDVLAVIEAAVDRGARHQARNLLAHIRKLFSWALSRGTYGLERSPCSDLKPSDIVGKPAIRQRILTDEEWRAFWKATNELAEPFGSLFRALALTGCRRDELASAKWTEMDLDKMLFTLGPERMKAGAAHVVPLSTSVADLIKVRPRTGEYVFTTTGKTPVSGFSKAKARLDDLMREELPDFIDWRLHDLRRSVRTGLSALGVQDRIAEMTIGHTVQGLHKVYDLHRFLSERRDALERWEIHLRGIVGPGPDNIISLASRAR